MMRILPGGPYFRAVSELAKEDAKQETAEVFFDQHTDTFWAFSPPGPFSTVQAYAYKLVDDRRKQNIQWDIFLK